VSAALSEALDRDDARRSDTACAAELIRRVKYEVGPNDPVTFALVVAIIAVAGVFASYVPARRATRVDPIVVLRYE